MNLTQPVPRARLVPAVFALTLAAAAVTATWAAPPGWALETRTGSDVVIAEGETVTDDLYVAASSVTVRGTIEGDLVTTANDVVIEGTVEGDLVVAANTVVIRGRVADDVRGAAASLRVEDEGRVDGDFIGAAYGMETTAGTALGGDLAFIGYQAVLRGEIADDVKTATAALVLDGRVGGDVRAVVGSPGDTAPNRWSPSTSGVEPIEPGLRVTGAAGIGGDLTYDASQAGAIDSGAAIEGDVTFNQVAPAARDDVASQVFSRLVDAVRTFITLMLVGLLVALLLPRTLTGTERTLRQRPWVSLGWGALVLPVLAVALVAVVALTVFLAVLLGVLTLGGLVGYVVIAGLVVVGTLVLTTVLAVGLLAPIVVGFAAGRLMLRRPAVDTFGGRLLSLLVGVAAYAVVQAIPVLGVIVTFLVVLFGLGAIIVWAWTSRRRSPSPQLPAPSAPAPAASVASAPPTVAAGV